MIDNLFICINGIIPIFLLILIGILLKKLNMIDDTFSEKSTNLVFKLFLPVLIFNDISTAEIAKYFDAKIVGFATLSIFVLSFASWAIAFCSTKDNKKRAAFAQGAMRTNYAILGLPLTRALFPAESLVNATVILAICMVVNNILAIVVLETFLNRQGGIKSTIMGIIKNPIIIASVIGSVFCLCGIKLPTVATNTLAYIGEVCVPLSLITIGASLIYDKVKSTFGLALWGSILKTLINPVVFMVIAVILGIYGDNLGVLFIFWASPSAVAGYAMTRNMGGDYDLSGNIIMISTVLSFFVMFFGMFILKNIGLV